MKVAIDRILIGDRVRKDLGDMARLGESIQERGLLHPVVVNHEFRLIAAQRGIWYGYE